MTHEYATLIWDESGDLAELLGELDDADFDAPSLCEGWRVRDVVSHMIVGHTSSMPQILLGIAKYKGNVPKGSFEMSKAYGSAHTPDEIRDAWSRVAKDHTRKGISRTIPYTEGFTDHLIHQQDIRRPLDRPRAIDSERLTAALDALPQIGGFLKSKKRMADFQWKASDVDWTWGTGPVVEGTAEALILAASGRPVVLDELTGDGVSALGQRIRGS